MNAQMLSRLDSTYVQIQKQQQSYINMITLVYLCVFLQPKEEQVLYFILHHTHVEHSFMYLQYVWQQFEKTYHILKQREGSKG